MKQRLLRIAKSMGGFELARRATSSRLRILGYHGIWTTPGDQFGEYVFITPEQFERRMVWLKRSRYTVIPLDEAIDALDRRRPIRNCVVLTIDDGWRSTYTHMLPVLEHLRLPATLYVTTWYVDRQAPIVNVAVNYVLQCSKLRCFTWADADGVCHSVQLGTSSEREMHAIQINKRLEKLPRLADRVDALRQVCALAEVPTEPWWSSGQFHLMSREEIRDAHRRGLDIQLHTHRHRGVRVYITSLGEEIADNREVLRKACGVDNFRHFCYPSGIYDPIARAILASSGVTSAVLSERGLNTAGADPYALRRLLDGRPVSDEEFEAYLSGVFEVSDVLRRSATRIPGVVAKQGLRLAGSRA
jgi:peptidoglycan/xylan/chitin deacetylase (PgdA/CDA1 family)